MPIRDIHMLLDNNVRHIRGTHNQSDTQHERKSDGRTVTVRQSCSMTHLSRECRLDQCDLASYNISDLSSMHGGVSHHNPKNQERHTLVNIMKHRKTRTLPSLEQHTHPATAPSPLTTVERRPTSRERCLPAYPTPRHCEIVNAERV